MEADQLMIRFRPHENLIMEFQAILLWKRPLVLAILVLIVNGILFFSYLSQAGFFAFLALCMLVIYIISFLLNKFNLFVIRFLFPPLKPEDESKGAKLMSFDDICMLIEKILRRATMIFDYLVGNQMEHGVIKVAYVAAVWLTLAFVFNLIGKFWILLIIVNACLILPGFLLNPENQNQIASMIHNEKSDAHEINMMQSGPNKEHVE